MNAKHTPGPWQTKHISKDTWEISGTEYTERPGLSARDAYSLCSCVGEAYDEFDALLIAAAPDLLAALNAMVSAFNVDDIDPLIAIVTIEHARAAIEKATTNG